MCFHQGLSSSNTSVLLSYLTFYSTTFNLTMKSFFSLISAVAADNTIFFYPEKSGFDIIKTDVAGCYADKTCSNDSELTFPNATLVGGMFTNLGIIANDAHSHPTLLEGLNAQWNHPKVNQYLNAKKIKW